MVKPNGSQPIARCALFAKKGPDNSLAFDYKPIQRKGNSIMRDDLAAKANNM
jgi:hypothetical protein